jgi:uncharacterized membrane protein
VTWQQRYRLTSFLRSSVWLPPVLGMVMALLLLPLIRQLDARLGWEAAVRPDGARAVLGALAASMLTFIVFVFSILLVAVQLASAQLTPRIIAIVYRAPVVKVSLTFFVFTFTYTVGMLGRIGDTVPQIGVWLAIYSNVVSIGLFIFMFDRFGKALRPVSILTFVGHQGLGVVREVYPRTADGGDGGKSEVAPPMGGSVSRVVTSRTTGAVLAFDAAGLVEAARRADVIVELVPQVGEFVTEGDPLFRIYGTAPADDGAWLESVALGPERTLEQDPEFAFRIIVDIAAKALSPAINDPTTGVLSLDQIHRLLREVAARQLDSGRVPDADGRLRLAYRTPGWDDFVSLSVTEIRHFGRESIQVVRRMRAMLENLIAVVPPHRVALLRAELELLSRGAARDFRDPEDQLRAASADSLGVGGAGMLPSDR